MSLFKPTFLYVKKHSITNKLYFGKTCQNPETYLGSGTYWLRHINKHGKEHVVNLWYCLFLDKESITEFATTFSKKHNIIESTEWANLDNENGIDGGYRKNNFLKTFNKQPRSTQWRLSQSKSQPKDRTICKHIQIDDICFPAMIDAAKFYSVSEQTIYNWIKRGKAIKI